VTLAARGGDGAVVARAGSGKTHTLQAVAEATAPRPTLLLAFNRAIAREAAGRLPGHVRVATVHALAYRALVRPDARLRAKVASGQGGVPSSAWVELAGLDARDPDRHRHVAAMASLLRGFLASDDAEPRADHLPSALRAELADTLGRRRATDRERWLARRTGRAWRRMADRNDPAPLSHDGYLKLFALSRPRLDAELLLVDEAQDLAPGMLAILTRQPAARLLVGDPAQRIYGWRGAVDAMAASGFPEVRLTASFRFGPEIAGAARRVLRVLAPHATLRGAGPPGRVATGPWGGARPRTLLCRSNVGLIEAALALGEGGVHAVGGLDPILAPLDDAYRLWCARGATTGPGRGRGTARPDPPPRSGVLAGLGSWEELCAVAEARGGPARTLQRLVERHGDGVPALRRGLRRAQRRREVDAPLVLSTVHRAKGREWDRVELYADLPRVPANAVELAGAPDPDAARAEANLLYVATTRARRELGLARVRDDLKELLIGRPARAEAAARPMPPEEAQSRQARNAARASS
jgi:superfamily I DNA/RNA helicase